jgi:hypothetical protein
MQPVVHRICPLHFGDRRSEDGKAGLTCLGGPAVGCLHCGHDGSAQIAAGWLLCCQVRGVCDGCPQRRAGGLQCCCCRCCLWPGSRRQCLHGGAGKKHPALKVQAHCSADQYVAGSIRKVLQSLACRNMSEAGRRPDLSTSAAPSAASSGQDVGTSVGRASPSNLAARSAKICAWSCSIDNEEDLCPGLQQY